MDVSEKILSYLDYHSFVWFKRSCRFVYNFLEDRPDLEKSALRRKLSSDWTKTPKIHSIPTTGLPRHFLSFALGWKGKIFLNNFFSLFTFW